MRNTLILSALVAGVMAGITPALATDADVPPEFRSSKFEVYAGVFGAADTLHSDYTNNETVPEDLVAGELDGTNFGYGIRGGLDYVMDGWLIGAVGDWSFGGGAASNTLHGAEASLENLATLRARAGFTLGNSVLYLTGGLAKAQVELGVNNVDLSIDDSSSSWSTSWTLGGGIDIDITDSLTLGVEYLYVDVEDNTYTLGVDPDTVDFSHEVEGIHTVRVGMNYAFQI